MRDHCSRRGEATTQLSFWMVLAVAALVVFGLLTLRGSSRAVGQKLPTLELVTLAGEPQTITLADLKGRVTVVNLWSINCGPCNLELPHIAELGKKFGSRDDFRLLAISCRMYSAQADLDELRIDTLAHLEATGLEIEPYADPSGETILALHDLHGGAGVPMTIVLDQQGVVRGSWSGYRPGMEKEVQGLVNSLFE